MALADATAGPTLVVLDTNVWLDLLWFDDPRCRWLLQQLESGHWRALCDAECRREWHRVLGYPALSISPQQADALRLRFDALANDLELAPHEHTERRLPRCRDLDDQKFVELAVYGGASLLLSRDAKLLALDRRVRAISALRIQTPEQAGLDPPRLSLHQPEQA
jgi:predicted nucleic acid-binding protein